MQLASSAQVLHMHAWGMTFPHTDEALIINHMYVILKQSILLYLKF